MKLPNLGDRRRAAEKIGGYEIREEIGRGGMCAVYKARQKSLDRPVAVKVLLEQLSDHAEVRERFEREAQIIARLNHPNIIHVIDRGLTPEGMPYFVMEHIDGVDLAQTIRDGRLDFPRKIELALQICKALSYAHRNGVIHRDIKPTNVLLDADGNALVLDFGIAKLFGENLEPGSQNQTRADLVLGTLAYMSPEQQSGDAPITAASDLYSFGVLLYELFTGTKPYGRFRPPSAIDPEIPELLNDVIQRCLEPRPEDRFPSADAVRDHLLQILQGAHLHTEQRERAQSGLSRIQDKFALLDVIKEDGFGAVYLYQDRTNRNLLVIKKQLDSKSGLQEARLLTSLKHKNVVNVLGASGDDQCFIVVMEYLNGGSLKDRLLQALPVPEALRIAQEMAEGLSFAHRNRVVHGNMRPGNVLFSDSGEAKLSDFGLDEHYSKGDVGNWYNPFNEPRSVGADLFALGTILYQMLVGAVPIWRDGLIVPHAHFRQLPAELRDVVGRLLSRYPSARFSTCDQALLQIHALWKTCAEREPDPDATQFGIGMEEFPPEESSVLQRLGQGLRKIFTD